MGKSNGQYLAVTDYPYVHDIDPDTFAVKAKYGLSITEGISMSSSTHWRREVNKDSSLQFHMIYNPLTMNFWSMPKHHFHPFESLRKLDDPTRFYLINLHDGSVIDGFQTDNPALVFSTHHMNAWEEGGEVVFDLACNPWDAMATYMDIPRMMNQSLSNKNKADFEMKRVRLSTVEKSVRVEDWPNSRGIPMLNTLDFPMINNNYNGKKNRYAYGWVSIDYWRQTLVKKDLEDTMNDKMWSQNSHYPGEVFFIPR